MRSSSSTRRWPQREGFDARLTMVAAAIAGAAVVGAASTAYASNQAGKAADAQGSAAQAGIDQQNSRFDAVQKLLQPYVTAGYGGLTGQQDLNGMNGPDAQAKAIAALQASPQYTSQLAAGNNNILQNASATGNLRGGNTQAALGQFGPALLSSTINDQYARLGGMTSIGQNAAAGVGNAGMQTGTSVANLLQQQGAAAAGGALANGNAASGYAGIVAGSLGTYAGLGGFRSNAPPVTQGSTAYGYNGTYNNPSAYVAGNGF